MKRWIFSGVQSGLLIASHKVPVHSAVRGIIPVVSTWPVSISTSASGGLIIKVTHELAINITATPNKLSKTPTIMCHFFLSPTIRFHEYR